MAEWYYKIAEQVVGPLSADQLKALADGGRLSPGDPIAKSPEGPWAVASRVKGLFEVAAIDDEPEEASSYEPVSKQTPPVAVAGSKPVEAPIKEPPIPLPPVVMPPQAPSRVAPPQQASPAAAGSPAVESAPAGGFGIQTEGVATTERFQKKKREKKPKEPKEPLTKKQKNARLVKWLAVGIVGGIVVLMSIPYVRDLTQPVPESVVVKDPIAADVDLAGADAALEGSFGTSSSRAAGTRPGSAARARTMSSEADRPMEVVEQVFEASGSSKAVQVKPIRVVLDRPLLVSADGQAARPSNRFLLVEMELSTKSRDASTRFRGWISSASEISLTDDRGVEYAVRTPQNFRGRFVDGQCQEMVFLTAGKPTTDVIMFAWPEDKAPELPSTSEEELKLRLPKSVYGEEGELLIAIPLSEIDVSEEAMKKPRGEKPKAENLQGEKPQGEMMGTSDNVKEDDGGPIKIPGLMD